MERLGKKKFAIPIGICLFVTIVLSLMFYPIVHMELRGLPLAVVSEDAGAQTPMGTVNAGDSIVESMLSMNDSGDLPFAWHQVESKDALDAALEDGQYYAALYIPENFTKASLPGGTPVNIILTVDHAKTPIVGSLLGPMLQMQLTSMGAPVELQALHEASFEGDFSAANPVAPTISQQIMITILMIMSMITGIISTFIVNVRQASTKAEKAQKVGQQLVYGLVISAVISLCIVCVAAWVIGVSMPLGTVFVTCWVASWCVIVLFNGLANIHVGLAVLGVLCMVSAMMCGVLPPEALPTFWLDWVYPWAPQAFLGDALRASMYAEQGIFNPELLTLLILPALGIMCSAVRALMPVKATDSIEA